MKHALSISILLLAAIHPGPATAAQFARCRRFADPKASRRLAPSPTGKPVARVNGAVLTDGDLLREEYTIFPYARQHNGSHSQPRWSPIFKRAQ